MGTVAFVRRPRRTGPVAPTGDIELHEPPVVPEPAAGGIGQIWLYVPVALGSLAMMLVFVRAGAGTLAYLGMGLMVVSVAAGVIVPFFRNASDHKERMHAERRDYHRYLTQTRRKVRKALVDQHRAARWLHPDPRSLWSAALSQRLWERRTAHDDFGEVRIGIGNRKSTMRLKPPATKPIDELEPMAAHALRRFLRAYTSVTDAPIAIYLRGYARVQLHGRPEATRPMVRALLAQAVFAHAPGDLRLVFGVADQFREEWDWVKWLPHAQADDTPDAAGPRRLFTTDPKEADKLLTEVGLLGRPAFEPDTPITTSEPFTIVVFDGLQMPPDHRVAAEGYRNAVILDLGGAIAWQSRPQTLFLEVSDELVEMVTFDHLGKPNRTELCRPDRLGIPSVDSLARSMSKYRIGTAVDADEPMATDYDLAGLLNIPDVEMLDLESYRRGRGPSSRLRVPIGITTTGQPIELDIKEAAENGMGPHGMMVGATGSGKSELLRTLVLALAVRHSSEELNFILVDFKGGAAFLGFDRIPHTAAIITNLADEAELVDRLQDAITGEMVRRQEHLRASGNYASRRDYEMARAGGAPLEPLPALFIVVDEFSELLTSKPQFVDTFAMIGRLGRSLAVHLLLASQRLDDGRIHQIESHLSYRIGLRTFSAMESRSVIGVPDAYELPNAPGNGYLRSDINTLTRFKGAYSSGPYRAAKVKGTAGSGPARLLAFGTDYIEPQQPEEEPEETEEDEKPPALSEVLLERMRGIGPAAHTVWLPPLREPATLDKLLPPLIDDEERGLMPTGGYAPLVVPIGLLDMPAQQRRELLLAELSGAKGNVGIVGGPQAGKSTLLRTLITGLALTHSPRDVQFYCLDFGGGSLASVAKLPHVGSVANRLDRDRVTRTVQEMSNLLAFRENLFSQNNIDSMANYRRARAAGVLRDKDPYGDVFLVVDGWYTVRQDFDELDSRFQEIAARGLSFGIHLVIAANRWAEMRPWLRDVLGTRFELRLGDPIDSEINSKFAATVPAIPGRGIVPERLHFLGALPRVDGDSDEESLSDATADLVEMIASGTAPRAPEVRLLPAELPATALPKPGAASPSADPKIVIGLDDARLQPMWHDFDLSPHLLIFGDAETGKTNMLKHVARSITSHFSPDEAKIVFGDFRRELYDAVPQEYQTGYSVAADALTATIKEAAGMLKERVPGNDITPDRLPRRDWWTGHRLFVLVDDFELAEGGRETPIDALLPLLPQGADIGLHLIIARRTAGASRAMMNATIRRAWELGAPALLLSCPREEGSFLGTVKPRLLPTGRAQYIDRRRTVRLVQTPVSAS
ncbi:type VII secretion protein EccCa [Catenuloplanes atrovinosus]|uniref:S-DNA-T family DNA segregation ATPase FtsK/SpoIIIE n=1 Tax=Catenuloplanes atrovinosus TaxID=137266 RepID=A0AAE3YID9_9ACTN|nr:type VII secretion protein EccCa [Catenuloplanes atrovinosus]MDR7274264.1 S-DNA-T family DNA segregation ATPase FtsK/SpoIIIE [Catenuloplanes atrovinosus]